MQLELLSNNPPYFSFCRFAFGLLSPGNNSKHPCASVAILSLCELCVLVAKIPAAMPFEHRRCMDKYFAGG
jgi:hypothetical protein